MPAASRKPSTPSAARAERLAAELRENLKRRKARAKALAGRDSEVIEPDSAAAIEAQRNRRDDSALK